MASRFGADETLRAATVDVLAGTLGVGREHAERVFELARGIGERLGLDERELRELGYAARLHDIGKAGVPARVLGKAGGLDDDEWMVVEGQSVWGSSLLDAMPGLAGVARIVRHQRERYDGEGYPDGLSGRDIPLASRILAVADAYVSMMEDRPFRRARPRFEVDHEFREGSGRQFDPYVVEALRAVVSAREE